MAKVKVPERIIHLTQQLRERYSCNKNYEERAYRMHKGETFCENVTIRQKLKEIMELKKIISKKSDKEKFNRILSISKNELEKMEDITDVSGDNQYVKIFLKVERYTEEEIQTSIENILDENIELSELRFIKEAMEFMYPREIATYFVIF